MTPRLTEAQAATLELVAAGKVSNINTGHGSWRIWGASPTVVGRLKAMGLTVETRVDERTFRFDLTEAGLKLQPLKA